MAKWRDSKVVRWGLWLTVGIIGGVALLLGIAYWLGSPPPIPRSDLYGPPEPVNVEGYHDDLMEPFLTRDGSMLFFNNSNDPAIDTDIHWAVRVDDLHFRHMGAVGGANSPALDGVPCLTEAGELYFVSIREYFQTFETIFRGRFASGTLSGLERVPGLSRKAVPWVNFDVECSPDGLTLWTVDGWFGPLGIPLHADLVMATRPAGSGLAFVRATGSAHLLALVNSPALEYAAGISSDGLELFFTRFGTPPLGREPFICLATRSATTDPFGPPVHLAALDGFVEAPTQSPDGKLLYFHRRVDGRFRLYLSRRRR